MLNQFVDVHMIHTTKPKKLVNVQYFSLVYRGEKQIELMGKNSRRCNWKPLGIHSHVLHKFYIFLFPNNHKITIHKCLTKEKQKSMVLQSYQKILNKMTRNKRKRKKYDLAISTIISCSSVYIVLFIDSTVRI